MCDKRNETGLILTDLMLALSIGVILMGILAQTFLSSQSSLRRLAGMARALDNAQTALHIIDSEVRMAGYIGCPRLSASFIVASNGEHPLTLQNRIQGDGLDAITVRHAQARNVLVLGENARQGVLDVTNHVYFNANDIVLVSDCRHAEIARIKTVSRIHGMQEISFTQLLHYRYDKSAEISLFEQNRIFVGADRHDNSKKALFVRDIHGSSHELVEGIANAKFLYSIPDAEGLRDVQAADVTDWSAVAAVTLEIGLDTDTGYKTWHAYAPLQT